MTNDVGQQPEWARITEEEKASNSAVIKALKSDHGRHELPSIQQVLKQARRAMTSAVKPATKIARLRYYIQRLDYIIQTTSAKFEKRLAEGAIDDPESFHRYLDEARHGIANLTLQIERASLLVDEPRTKLPTAKVGPTSESLSSPSTIMTAPVLGRESYVSIDQVATFLGISRRTFSNMRREHPSLMEHKIGKRRKLFFLSEVNTWLADLQEPVVNCNPIQSTMKDYAKSPMAVRLTEALAEAMHIDGHDAPRLAAWINEGCRPLPVGERIHWRTGRKTLCTFIVCAQQASLLALKIGAKKSGKSGPLYEKAVIGGFLDQGESIKGGIDRNLVEAEAALSAFREIIVEYRQSISVQDDSHDALLAEIKFYFEQCRSSDFAPYSTRLEEMGFHGKKTVSILSALSLDILLLFGKLDKA